MARLNKGIANNKINMLGEGKDTEETDGRGLKSMTLVSVFCPTHVMKSHLLLKRTQGKLKARNPAKARLALLITLLCLTTPSMGQKIYPCSSPSLDSLCSLSFIPSLALLVPRHSIPQCQRSCVSLQPRLLMFYRISY